LLQFETPPDRRRAALKPTSPWYFEEFLSQSWKDGIRTGSALFRLSQERGYDGSLTHLQRLLAGWRRAEQQTKAPSSEHQILKPDRDPETAHAISPVIAAALCIKPRGKLTSDQARKVDTLKTGSPAFTTMRSLTMRFNGIMRGRQADPLPAWIDDAIETDLAPIVCFARTLNRDYNAVKNAIEMSWSNGQAECQINRLKTLKRAM
jgi:transposase